MKTTLAILGLCVLCAAAARAGDIYRWVDDKGRVQLSDRVPEEYKNSATHMDSKQYELTPAQRKEAEERVAREKGYAAEREAKAKAAEAEAAKAAASAASAALATKTAVKPAP